MNNGVFSTAVDGTSTCYTVTQNLNDNLFVVCVAFVAFCLAVPFCIVQLNFFYSAKVLLCFPAHSTNDSGFCRGVAGSFTPYSCLINCPIYCIVK